MALPKKRKSINHKNTDAMIAFGFTYKDYEGEPFFIGHPGNYSPNPKCNLSAESFKEAFKKYMK